MNAISWQCDKLCNHKYTYQNQAFLGILNKDYKYTLLKNKPFSPNL